MKRTWILMFLLILIITACGGEVDQPTVIEPDPVETELVPSPTASPVPSATYAFPDAQVTPMVDMPQPAAFDGLSLPTERGEYFSASGACVVCHTNHMDADGNDV